MLSNAPWQDAEAPWLTVAAFGVAMMLASAVVFWLMDSVMKRAAARTPVLLTIRKATRKPAHLIFPLLALAFVLYEAPDQLPAMAGVRQGITVALVICVTWLAMRVVSAVGDAVLALHRFDDDEYLAARGLQTQTKLMTRAVMSIVGLFGVAMAFMTFPNVRHIGASLLASAGLAGIVAGLAARPLLGNLIAGLQIGLTQRFRLGDVVIVQGEWGEIEEITGTYVVVRLWDLRRLIVPLEWWTQNPFQNWTRSSSNLVGTVFLWVDYRMPLEPLRQELKRLCESSDKWDEKTCVLQVTEAGEHAMQLRCLVSAANASACWDLRCLVREGLLTFIQSKHVEYLPRMRMRADVGGSPSALNPQMGFNMPGDGRRYGS